MLGSRRLVLAAVLLALTLPPAVATGAPARVELSTPDAVLLQADVRLSFPGGAARIESSDRHGAFEIRGATGRLVIETWNATHTPFGPIFDAGVGRHTHELANATLRFHVAGGAFALNVRASPDGAVSASGRVDAEGAPTRLSQDYDPRRPLPLIPSGGEYVDVELFAGDAFVGNDSTPSPLVGYPLRRDASLGLEGRVRFHVHGGEVEFVDAGGRPHRYRLGNWSEATAGELGGVRREVWQRLLVEGTVADAEVPTGEHWIAGGPDALWRIDGDLRWTRASGRVVTSEGVRVFRDALVEGRGVVALVPAAEGDLLGLDAARYEAEGAWTRLTIGGAPAAPQRVATAAVAGWTAALASVLTALGYLARESAGRALGLLYTRLSPHRLLDHPTRRRIVEEARAAPGLHLRELHRRVGGAWGPFAFHLGMLQQAGHVRVRPEGGFRAVYPPDAASAPRVPHSATARAVLDALPEDGTPVKVAQLRERLGLSRQLVDYHLRALQAQGLASLAGDAHGRTASRAAAHASQAAGAPTEA